jgi:hypothetical protein
MAVARKCYSPDDGCRWEVLFTWWWFLLESAVHPTTVVIGKCYSPKWWSLLESAVHLMIVVVGKCCSHDDWRLLESAVHPTYNLRSLHLETAISFFLKVTIDWRWLPWGYPPGRGGHAAYQKVWPGHHHFVGIAVLVSLDDGTTIWTYPEHARNI